MSPALALTEMIFSKAGAAKMAFKVSNICFHRAQEADCLQVPHRILVCEVVHPLHEKNFLVENVGLTQDQADDTELIRKQKQNYGNIKN